MEPGGVNFTPQPTMVFPRLHPIVEDESEEMEDSTSAGDKGTAIGNDSIESGHGTTKDSPRSFVASVKKAISSIGSNDGSRISDFVHINDCLKERSGTFSEPTDAFVSDLRLHLVMVRKGKHDAQLQAELTNRLRLLENDSKEVAAVFCELSARLLSIESDKDVITVTFRTFEEIWKFSTYYSLGFLNHCMENIFLDQTFWLTSLEDEGAGIQVLVNEESLNHIYKGLLMEEGILFALCADKCIRQATVVDNKVRIIESSPEAQRRTAGWTQPDSSSDEDGGLLPKAEAEPLCPFHQWFLRTNVGSDLVDFGKSELRNQMAVGWTEAVVNFDSDVPDEMSYQSGDIIETVSTYIECMEWFVGRIVTSGCVGFVKTQNVRPYTSKNGQESLSPVVCEDTIYTRSTEDFDLESAKALLLRISHSDVCHVYKLDEFEKIKVFKNKVSEERDQTPYNDSTNLKETLKEFLVNSNNCPEEITVFEENTDSSEAQTICDTCKDTRFCICEEQYEWLQSLLQFLNSGTYLPGFKKLYDVSYTFLTSLFYGYGEEEDLVRHLSVAREAAKKANMTWALARLCFLLGRLCTRKHKFSQARVYFEEAMGVLNGDFSDIFLFTAIHMNLNAIYLKQQSKEKSMQMMDKSSSLILGLQSYISNTDMEPVVLKYALKKAILSQDQKSERNACFLLSKTFTSLRQYDEALPYIERLQVLQNMTASKGCSPSRYYFQLADMYSHKCLPHLTLSCVKVASQNSCGLMESLRRVDFIIKNTSKLCGMKTPGNRTFPTQIAYHLKCALSSVVTKQEQELCTFMYLGIAELCAAHQLYKEARAYIMKAVNSGINRQVDIWIMLAWMYMLDGHSIEALDILNFMVSFSGCTQHQLGIINNLIAIAVRQGGMIKDAAKHYCKALQISKDTGNFQNQAMVLANLGTLCLHLKARIVAEHFLVRSVSVYSSVPLVDNRADFIHVLLILGHHYLSRDQKETGKLYYEWALLVAIESKNLQGQLHAIQLLCQFYSTYEVNEAQCIIYNEYQLSLAKKMADKVLEGQVLETISQLYLSLGTERACRSALEYTKQSLGIFIDLQAKEKEAYAWLMAGKIYYILGQNELVDLYIQVAQNVALCTGDPKLGMALYEACGDIFFNGTSDRDKAVTFYRDCALPLAVKTGNEKAELQLCNKLTGLLMSIKDYEEALYYAKTALALSVNLGNQLNERVAYHRLGGIYTHLNQCELAEHFYLKALSLCSSPLELEEETIYYMKVYLILGDIIFYHLKDPYDAAGYYHLALAAAMDLGNKKSQLKIYTQLAVIYHNFLMDREKSLFFYQKARAFATDLNVRRINLSPVQYYQNPP